MYNDEWRLGMVVDEPDEEGMVGVSFFRPAGSERVRSFTKPPKEDFLPVHLDDVLMIVEPLNCSIEGKTKRTTNLSTTDIKKSCELLRQHDK